MKKISQSFIVDMRAYMAGSSCGHIIREKWILDKLLDDESKAMKLGSYFEYIFTLAMTGTGSLPKNKITPRAQYLAASLKAVPKGKEPWDLNELGKPILGPDDMYAPYKLAHVNSERLQQYFKLMGIKIIQAGHRLTKGKFEGTIDLVCEATQEIKWANGEVWKVGYRFVIDLKYAGTLDDQWNKYGWGALHRPGEQQTIHGTQAIQYHYVSGGLPFYFMVVSSTNDIDVKFFKIEITEEKVRAHIAEANDLEAKLKFYESIGLEPRPDISKCGECPLQSNCKDKATYPQIEVVSLI